MTTACAPTAAELADPDGVSGVVTWVYDGDTIVVETVQDTIDLLSGLGSRIHVLDEAAGRIIESPEVSPGVIDYLFLHPDRFPGDAD